jgi:hypothetical protein
MFPVIPKEETAPQCIMYGCLSESAYVCVLACLESNIIEGYYCLLCTVSLCEKMKNNATTWKQADFTGERLVCKDGHPLMDLIYMDLRDQFRMIHDYNGMRVEF